MALLLKLNLKAGAVDPGQRQRDPFAFGIRSRRPHFKVLLDHSAVRNKKGETPQHFASPSGLRLKVALFLAFGADLAPSFQHRGIMVNLRVDVDAWDNDNTVPLLLAIRKDEVSSRKIAEATALKKKTRKKGPRGPPHPNSTSI